MKPDRICVNHILQIGKGCVNMWFKKKKVTEIDVKKEELNTLDIEIQLAFYEILLLTEDEWYYNPKTLSYRWKKETLEIDVRNGSNFPYCVFNYYGPTKIQLTRINRNNPLWKPIIEKTNKMENNYENKLLEDHLDEQISKKESNLEIITRLLDAVKGEKNNDK